METSKGKNTTNKEQKPSSEHQSKGGLMTISPPAKVKQSGSLPLILASGIDSLNLAIDVHWSKTDLFDYLDTLKDSAKASRQDSPGFFKIGLPEIKWPFTVKPHGKNGYEWMISNKEFTFLIGRWTTPQSKPSVLTEIRSETLWHLGAENAVELIKEILLSQGGAKITFKPSRVDLCVDALFSEHTWKIKLIEYATTRSTYMAPHFTHKKLTGLSIGRGKISARLYDKPFEIRQQSKKFWMYDIWGIDDVPDGHKIIRTEFQLRRELLTQLAINDITDLFSHCENIWAYCSQRWLKFQTNPGKHHTQRKTFKWWKSLQNGFMGAQPKVPLIRSKAFRYDIEQNTTQATGHIRALITALIAEHELDEFVDAEIEDGLIHILKRVNASEESRSEFANSVRAKIAKNHRSITKHYAAEKERKKHGFPTEY